MTLKPETVSCHKPDNLGRVVLGARREVRGGVEAVGGAGGRAARAARPLPARRLRARAHRQPLRARARAPRPASDVLPLHPVNVYHFVEVVFQTFSVFLIKSLIAVTCLTSS